MALIQGYFSVQRVLLQVLTFAPRGSTLLLRTTGEVP